MTRLPKGRELNLTQRVRHLEGCYNVLAVYVGKLCDRLGIKQHIPAKIRRKPKV